MLIPGYTTRGVLGIEGKYDLNTRAVNLELARITSDCPEKGIRLPERRYLK